MLAQGDAIDDPVVPFDSDSIIILCPSKTHTIGRGGIFKEIADRLQYPPENCLAYLNP